MQECVKYNYKLNNSNNVEYTYIICILKNNFKNDIVKLNAYLETSWNSNLRYLIDFKLTQCSRNNENTCNYNLRHKNNDVHRTLDSVASDL